MRKRFWVVKVSVLVPYGDDESGNNYDQWEERSYLVKATSPQKAWIQIFKDWGSLAHQEVLTNGHGYRFCAKVDEKKFAEIYGARRQPKRRYSNWWERPSEPPFLSGWEWGKFEHKKWETHPMECRYHINRKRNAIKKLGVNLWDIYCEHNGIN